MFRGNACIALLALIFFLHPSFAKEDKGFVEDKITQLKIKANLSLVDFSLYDDLNLSLKYYYEVQPSYSHNYYNRVDRLKAKASLHPADVLDDHSTIGLTVSKGAEFTFIRHFRSQKEALLAPPKSFLLQKIPITAQKAIDHLEPGEFVSFSTYLTAKISANVAQANDWATLSGFHYYLLKGEFLVRVFRKKNNKVQFQIAALKSKEKGAGAKYDLSPDFEIIGVSVVNRAIERQIHLDFMEVTRARGRDQLLFVDYELNLNYPEVRKAYDDTLGTSMWANDWDHLDQIGFRPGLEDPFEYLHGNLAAFEELHMEDHLTGVPRERARVHRNFMARNFSKSKSENIKIGLILAGFEEQSFFRNNHLTTYDAIGTATHYEFPSISLYKERGFFIGIALEESIVSFNSLIEVNKETNKNRFVNFGVYQSLFDKQLYVFEQLDMQEALRKSLPSYIYSNIPWEKWNMDTDKEVGRMTHEFYFHKDVFKHLEKYTRFDLEQALAKFIRRSEISMNFPRSANRYKAKCISKSLRNSFRYSEIGYYADDICLIAQLIKKIHSTDSRRGNNAEPIKDLARIPLFNHAFVGLIYSLLDEELALDSTLFKLKWSAQNIKPLEYQFGGLENLKLFEEILNIQSILNNRSYDYFHLDKGIR